MEHQFVKKCNVGKLHTELFNAGYKVNGVSWHEDGDIATINLSDIETKDPAVIVNAHTYTPDSKWDSFDRLTEAEKLKIIGKEYNEYLDSQYDPKTLMGMMRLDSNPSTSQAIKDKLTAVNTWIFSVVNRHYATLIGQVMADAPFNELDLDFSQHDATNPHFSQEYLLGKVK